ncbi:hypothetical protein Syun_023184 [Stephania yunnanensis]|uniref:Uncharacterized protein n=1 Tax=Stephania yunnanensis TaxID=152371 RepID=A0AAP0HZC0_9MAGN
MTEVPKKSEQEIEKTEKVGEPVGRRAQTTFYRKENELGRGAGASKIDCDLKEGVVEDHSSDLPGQQLAIRMRQVNTVEPSSSDATEFDKGEGREEESDENRDSEGEDGEGDKEGSGNGSGSGSGSGSASGS